ncbi:hypothetical protein HY949_00315 [Candidatus Gottesmanbacteria bacterium]|nr:hypothetical protein [Candidatus Gottesmanbacteria bacterium]
MSIKPLLGTVVGVSDDQHWGQVLSSPVAYGVVEVDDPGGHARDWGVKVLSTLSERTAQSPKSLKAAQEIAITSMEESVVSLILLVPVGAIVYIVVLGIGRVLLRRGESIAVLMDKPGAISGEVREGDTLILMTQSICRTLTREEISALFDHLKAPVVAEKMTLAIHAHKEHSATPGGAALVFQIQGLTPVENDVPVVANKGKPAFEQRSPGRRIFQRIRHFPLRRSLRPGFWRDHLAHMPEMWRRPMVPVTAILIVLFALSVVLGIRKQMAQKVEGNVAQVLTQAQHAFDEGVALIPLNPVKGRERLSSARDILAPIREGLSPTSVVGKAVTKLYQEVVDQLSVAMQVYQSDPSLFYDLSLLKAQAVITAIGQNNDTLVLLDTRGLTVATLTIPTKNGRIIAGGQGYQGMGQATIHGQYAYVLVEEGIHRVTIPEAKTTQNIIKRDAQWGAISSLVSYGGNLYLLDSGKSRIWKYIATDNGFSEMREYLNSDTLPDLSGATGMAIDGGVWVGTKDGRILHFVQGREETFAPRGVEPGLGKMLTVATSEEDKHLYILDADNHRVVVLDKDGVYIAQYVWTGNMRATELFVSEKLKLLLLLGDGKLYSIELK